MRAFHIHEGLPAAGLVLLLMNVATVVPLWPGNVGLVQVAVATPLRQYGVAYGKGIAFGFGLQAIEASVGVGVGLVFLAARRALVRRTARDAGRGHGRRRGRHVVRGGLRAWARARSRARLASRAAFRRPSPQKRSSGVFARSASLQTHCRSATAARARSTRCVTSSSRTRRSTRSVGRGPLARACWRTARAWWRRRRRSRSTATRLDVMAASSRGLGLLMKRFRDCPLVVTVGGTATMDGGAGMLEVLDRLPGPTRVLCDVATRLYDAPRLYGPAEGRIARPGGRARTPAALDAAPGAVCGAVRLGGGRRARSRARGVGRRARARSGGRARPARLRPRLVRPRRHRRGDRRRDDVGREGSRRWSPGAAARQARAASSSAAAWSRRRARRECPYRELSGDPARAEEDLVGLGSELGRALRGA